MRSHGKGALLFLLLLGIATCVALAQEQVQEKNKRGSSNPVYRATRETPDLQQKPTVSRAMTLTEGLEILGAALDSGHHDRTEFSPDCSHFVHGLYEHAGFPYEYASSSDLYDGVDGFRRVASPQPGDLAVWRGHAGIVVNPAQHSFFSALSSGPGVDSYDSPYWKQRGRPRFFRYVKPVPSGALSTSIRTGSLKPTALDNTEPHETAADRLVHDVSEESSSDTASSAKSAENQPLKTEMHVVVVGSVRPKPDQVTAAFLQACQDSEMSLRGRDLFKSDRSLIAFDRFEVKKVHVTGKQGWIEVQIDELVSLTGSKAEVHKRSELQRWPLVRRNHTSWELTAAEDTIYLPQPIAERVLAHELAKLTEDSPATASRTQEKAELARLLDVLFEK
jgi:hypothetical protein